MNDTSPEVEGVLREMIMSRSGEERFLMGARMFDAARELIIASLPAPLAALEFRQRLFQRLYGYPLQVVPEVSGDDREETKRGRL